MSNDCKIKKIVYNKIRFLTYKNGGNSMKIVLTDAQTVVDNLVPADRLSQFGEVVQYGLLKYDEVA